MTEELRTTHAHRQGIKNGCVKVGPFVLYAGRHAWSRETTVTVTAHFADLTIRGRFAGICWR